VRMSGIKLAGSDAVVTAKVPADLAVALREAARENCRTVSGEIRAMLLERFARGPSRS
jgi:hypothetical protein